MNLRILGAALLAAFLTLTAALHAQVPQIINYQGRVAVGTANFNGSGAFKFALVNAAGNVTYWSNDGTSTAGSQPTAAVTLTVTKGLYSVLLGDTALTNMTAIPNSAFNNSDVRLRVWFNDGTNLSQLLTPDQRIAAVGYAMVASGVALPATTGATTGVITQNGTSLMHSFGNFNFFAGDRAGNFTTSGSANAGIGTLTLNSNSSGSANTAIGQQALRNNTTGGRNTAVGQNALFFNIDGGSNTAVGFFALEINTAGTLNTALGDSALHGITIGGSNVGVGYNAGSLTTAGNNNTALGTGALGANSTGSGNIAIGNNAGNLLTVGSNNIAIGHVGVAGESNIIRIGTSQTDTYLTGIIHGNGSGLTGITSTGFSGTLAGDVTGAQGATVVANVGGVSAANIASGVNLANTLTGANLGAGTGVFSSRTGANLNFRSVSADPVAGSEGISITLGAGNNSILIGNTLTGINVGTAGAGTGQIFSGKTAGGLLNFRSLVAGANVALTTTGNDITISASAAPLADGSVTTAKLAPGLTFSTSGTTQAATVSNTTDNPAAMLFAAPFRNWWVGQNKAPDATTTFDNFFIYDQTANATRLRIDTAGVIYGNGAGLTGVVAANFSGALAGDVTGPQGATVVASVGGSSAANVHTAEAAANGATNANTANTIVKRDATGNFTAGTVTATAFVGDGSGLTNLPSGGGGGVILKDGNNVTLGKVISATNNGATVLTSTGYIVRITFDGIFAPAQIYYSGPGSAGTAILNDGHQALTTPPSFIGKVVVWSGSRSSLMEPTTLTNGTENSIVMTSATFDNPTNQPSVGTVSGQSLKAITNTAAGLPAFVSPGVLQTPVTLQ